MPEITVAVSGLSVVGVLAPGMPVISALRAAPGFSGRIVGLSYDPLEPPSYDPGLVDLSFLVPFPLQGPSHLMDRLRHVHERIPIDVIIPTVDSEMTNYIRLAPELGALGIATLLPDEELFALRSKVRLPDLGQLTGVRVPRSEAAYGFDAVLSLSREFRYPFVMKGHLYGATLVRGPGQLGQATEEQIAKWGYPVVLQEYVEGVEYDVVALGSRDGRLLGAVPMKKLQLDERGKAWGGITIHDPALIQAARRVVEGLRWPGPLELEMIRERGSGDAYLIEINPRFPAWIHLAVAAGQNLPWAAVRLALGEEVEPFPGYQVGTMSLRRCVDVTSPLSVYESLVMTGEVDHRAPGRDLIKPRFVPIVEREEGEP